MLTVVASQGSCDINKSLLNILPISSFSWRYLESSRVKSCTLFPCLIFHFRYEDTVLVPGQTVSVGLSLKSFLVTTTNENFEPSYVDRTKDPEHNVKVSGCMWVAAIGIVLCHVSIFLTEKLENRFSISHDQPPTPIFHSVLSRRYRQFPPSDHRSLNHWVTYISENRFSGISFKWIWRSILEKGNEGPSGSWFVPWKKSKSKGKAGRHICPWAENNSGWFVEVTIEVFQTSVTPREGWSNPGGLHTFHAETSIGWPQLDADLSDFDKRCQVGSGWYMNTPSYKAYNLQGWSTCRYSSILYVVCDEKAQEWIFILPVLSLRVIYERKNDIAMFYDTFSRSPSTEFTGVVVIIQPLMNM